MLKQPLPSRHRLVAGSVLVAALASFAGVAAWAAQPAQPRGAVEPGTPAPADAALESRLLHPPKYPAEAMAQKLTGRVVLLIDVDGADFAEALDGIDQVRVLRTFGVERTDDDDTRLLGGACHRPASKRGVGDFRQHGRRPSAIGRS